MDVEHIVVTNQEASDWFTPNSTTPHHERPALPYSMGVTILFGLAAGIISLVTIFGNTIVILSFFLEQSIRQPTNYFIASLAVSDLLIGAVSMPFYTVYLLTGQYWPLSEFLCNVWLTVDYTACMCSIYTVFSITVDRYCSVKIPAKYRIWRTKRKVLVVIACIWTVSVLLFFSSIFLWQTWISDRKLELGKCYVFYLEDALFNCAVQLGYFWITILAMITLYIAIYRVALDLQRKSEEKLRKTVAVVTQTNAATTRDRPMLKSETEFLDSAENSHVKGRTPSPTEAARLLDGGCLNSEHKDHGSINHQRDGILGAENELSSGRDGSPAAERKESEEPNNSQQFTFPDALKSRENANICGDTTSEKCSKLNSTLSRAPQNPQTREVPSAYATVVLKQSFSIDFRPGIKRESSFEHEINPVKSWSFDGFLESFIKNKIKHGKIKRYKTENRQLIQNSGQNSTPESCNYGALCRKNTKEEEKWCDMSLMKHISLQLSRATEMTGIKNFSTPQMGDIGRRLASKLSIPTVFRSIRVPETLQELLSSRAGECQSSSEANEAFKPEMNNTAREESVENTFTPDVMAAEKSISRTAGRDTGDMQTDAPSSLNKFSSGRARDFYDRRNSSNPRGDGGDGSIRAGPRHSNNSRDECETEESNSGPIEAIPRDVLVSPQSSSSPPSPTTNRVATTHSSATTRHAIASHESPSQIINAAPPPTASDLTRPPFSRWDNKRPQAPQSGAYTSHQKHKRANRARKALRTITIILGAFIVCFLPWHVLSMIMGFCPKNMICVSPMLYDISYWLCYLNSPINPFCYALANEQFKRTFARILRLDWHRI